MSKIKIWIRENQIAAFFMITFAISWGLGFSYDAEDYLFPLAAIATTGPALAGIIVTRICNTEPKRASKRHFWIAFGLSLVISTIVFLVFNVTSNNVAVNPIMVFFLALLSVPVAVVLSARFSRVPSLRRYLASVYQVRKVWGWLLLAPVVILAIDVLSMVISNMLGRQSISLADMAITGWPLLKMLVITFLYQLFFFNLTGEEIGWRGFALPRLLAKTNPIFASLILAFFWVIWHAFYWSAQGEPVLTLHYWLDTYVRLLPATVMINWFYIRSNGSILVAGVLHAISNTFFAYMPEIDWPIHTATLYGFTLLIILIDRWWKKLPEDHPAVIQVAQE